MDLSSNSIGGYYENGRGYGKVIATPEGPKAIADALRVCASITHIGVGGIDLRDNSLGDEGWGAIFAGVCSSKASKIASIDASRMGIGTKGAKLIAEALRASVNPSVTSVWTPAHQP